MSRSYLFVPANNERALARAHERGADILIIALEDAVPSGEKAQARAGLAPHVSRLTESASQVVMRVNGDLCEMAADLEALKDAPPTGLMIPKVRDAGQLTWIAESLALIGRADLAMIALVESARGLLNAQSIAAVPHVSAVPLVPRISVARSTTRLWRRAFRVRRSTSSGLPVRMGNKPSSALTRLPLSRTARVLPPHLQWPGPSVQTASSAFIPGRLPWSGMRSNQLPKSWRTHMRSLPALKKP